jgi:hypothetical protein
MALRILARAPLRLCDSLRCSASDLRFYSTQRAHHVSSKDTTPSDSVSKNKDDLRYRATYKRQWIARKYENDPEYRAKHARIQKERHAHNRATDSEWAMAFRQSRLASYLIVGKDISALSKYHFVALRVYRWEFERKGGKNASRSNTAISCRQLHPMCIDDES